MDNIKEINNYWKKNKGNDRIDLPKVKIQSRFDIFDNLLKDKSVLHVGCTDFPYTQQEINKKTLLHLHFSNICKDLYGIDIAESGLSIMKECGLKNIMKQDIYTLHENKELLNKKFDVIVVSEVLEHLLNPGIALGSIKKYVLKTNPNAEIIFTVPNVNNFLVNTYLSLKNKEHVHHDHKYYFSYKTFRKLIEEYNYQTNFFSFIIYNKYPNKLYKKAILNLISNISPSLTPHLLFKCKVKKNKNKEENK